MAEERHARASTLMPAPWSRAPASCRSARETAWPSTRMPTMPGSPSTDAATSLLSGITPQARFWTLTLYNPEGRLVANSAQRHGFTSQEIIRNADGSFDVTVGPRARPGNWLPTGGVETLSSWCCGSTTRRSESRRAPAATRRCLPSPGGLPVIRLAALAAGRRAAWRHRASGTVLLLPRMASQDAYARLSAIAPVNAVTPCPLPRRRMRCCRSWTRPLHVSVCRYDLSRGPLKFSVPVSQAYTSVSFYTRSGVAYYAINDRAAGRRIIELDLMTARSARTCPRTRKSRRPTG